MGVDSDYIKELAKKIEKYGEHFRRWECRVREQIVLPILSELGWDTSDPDQVIPEHSVSGGRPDYSLEKDGIPLLFIEVKTLSKAKDVERHLGQLREYAKNKNMSYMLITNGELWFMFDTREKDDSSGGRKVFQVAINGDLEAIDDCVNKLNLIARSEIEKLADKLQKIERPQTKTQLSSPPKTFPLLVFPSGFDVRSPEDWKRLVRSIIDDFYQCEAVSYVHIRSRGENFDLWRIELYDGNDPKWLQPFMDEIIVRIQQKKSEAGLGYPKELVICSISSKPITINGEGYEDATMPSIAASSYADTTRSERWDMGPEHKWRREPRAK